MLSLVINLFTIFATAEATRAGGHYSFSKARPVYCRLITVDQSGSGHFKTIQAAIDSVPTNNNQWVCIRINNGIYREQVIIPEDKPYIYLKGATKQGTVIMMDSYGSISTAATFISKADNIRAKSITFLNSYNYPLNRSGNPVRQAVAAMISGDKLAFYKCRFLGLQDTLWDVNGRHFYYRCTIQGAVDFIFGSGQSIFEDCKITAVAGVLGGGYIGYITAHGRESPQETSAFVFKHCNITGNGKVYLGRPWRKYARVIYYKTTMSNVVVPEGWDPWASVGEEYKLTFAEIDSQGVGFNTTARVQWANLHRYNLGDLLSLTKISYVDNEGWLGSIA